MSNRKLKVLVVIPSAFCFGLQHVSIDLFGAVKSSIEPHFLITRWNDGEFEKHLKRSGFEYSFSWLGMFSRKMDWVNMRMSITALIKLPKLYFDFLKLCRLKKPEILFFANHHELVLLLPVLWFIRIKVVCHMHDPSPAIPFQKRTFFWYGSQVDHFIAISRDVKKRLMDLGCQEKKISVVHNGIAMPEAGNRQRSKRFIGQFAWPEDVCIVGITGQMTATKGHEDLVEAFSIAIQDNPKLRLVIGGKLLEPLFTSLTLMIEKKGIKPYVGFSGWVKEVGMFYEAIDIFILASRHDEGYGLVVAESMSYGKPVVITNSGGATEIVENGVNGYIVPKQNSKKMAEKMLLLSIDHSLYLNFSSKAIERIKNDFAIEIAASRFSELMKAVE